MNYNKSFWYENLTYAISTSQYSVPAQQSKDIFRGYCWYSALLDALGSVVRRYWAFWTFGRKPVRCSICSGAVVGVLTSSSKRNVFELKVLLLLSLWCSCWQLLPLILPSLCCSDAGTVVSGRNIYRGSVSVCALIKTAMKLSVCAVLWTLCHCTNSVPSLRGWFAIQRLLYFSAYV